MVGKEKTPKVAVAEKKEVQKKKNDDSSSSKSKDSSSEKSAPPQPNKASSKVIPKKVAEKSGGEKKKEKKEGVPLQNKKREGTEIGQASSKKSKKEEKQLSEDDENQSSKGDDVNKKQEVAQSSEGDGVDEKKEQKQSSEKQQAIQSSEKQQAIQSSEKPEKETPWCLVVGTDSPVTKDEIYRFLTKTRCSISKIQVVESRKEEYTSAWGSVYVWFPTYPDAVKVLALNGRDFKDKPITVQTPKKNILTKACKTVVVKEIIDEGDIRELFHDFKDDITKIRPFYKSRSDPRIIFNFVEFNTHASVLKALKFHRTMFKGACVYVDYDSR